MSDQHQTFMHPSELVRSAHAELIAAARVGAFIDGHISQKVEAQINRSIVAAAVNYYNALYPPAEIAVVNGEPDGNKRTGKVKGEVVA